MTDLVTRLREADAKLTAYCEGILGANRDVVSSAHLYLEAADEIDRLLVALREIIDQADVADARSIASTALTDTPDATGGEGKHDRDE